MNHTPEPWRVDADRTYATLVITDNAEICEIGEYWPAKYMKEAEANAARIVSCVNALAGLNPEGVRDVAEALEAHLEFAKWMVAIGAAEGPIATNHVEEAAYRHKAIIDQTRAALAKVRAQS